MVSAHSRGREWLDNLQEGNAHAHVATPKSITAFVILTICSIIAVIPSPQARASEADVPPQLAGMEQFITVTDENRLSLDAENAKEAGYSDDSIELVAEQLASMNNLLANKQATLDIGEYSVSVYYRSTRAKGVNKTVVHWWGVTEYWMDSDRAQQLIEALENNDTAAGIIPGWVGDISSMVTGSMLLQLKQAASKGTGVIMYTQIIAGTSVTNTWFTPQ